MATREKAAAKLRGLGFSFPEPCGNFIFATHRTCSARELFAALREADIFVRYFDKPRIDNYLRITIGTDEQMNAVVKALKEILSEKA